ncbi:hypothetical protein AVEN_32885-1 [Araneus ventricosus]|uniref:Uncharacterized protein n=1 Tax=Araneus ventricosus TaxID=182803 RepID=A0A4Y2UGI9_ARAVE|nr:hypothetical protein AVEN_14682-1 [Araneus ventricosus]GBO10717.1 hypothetical protein AVEN_32885-1 [Araneus ventricosus]
MTASTLPFSTNLLFVKTCSILKIPSTEFTGKYCYEHGMSLPSNVSLMVGKRVLQGYVWKVRGNGAIDPDLGDKFADFGGEVWDLKSTGIFLISLLGTEIHMYPDDSM